MEENTACAHETMMIQKPLNHVAPIGALLKAARRASGLTQSQVAKQLNTNKSAISRIENHAVDIKLSTLQRYVAVVGKTLDISIK